MAQDGEQPKSVDKGKGKATDGEPSKPEEVKKDKDGKPIPNGKKEDGPAGGMACTVVLVVSVLIYVYSRGAQRGRSATEE